MFPMHNSVGSRTRNLYKKFLLLALLPLAMLLLSACDVDRYGTNWPTDVVPPNVCPGDNVTLSWDAYENRLCIGDGCPDPVQVQISSNPADVIGGRLEVGATGTQEAGPIDVLTTFTFSKTGGYYTLPAHTHSVNVVLPTRETNIALNFPSSCAGASATWERVDLSIPNFRSEGVRLVRVCNNTRKQTTLALSFTTGDLMRWTLSPGMCTEELPPDLGRKVLEASASALIISPVICDTTTSLPADIQLTGVLTCDLTTMVAPLVAATEAPSTDETNQPGIIYLESLTPTTTTTSTPLGGLTFDLPGISLDHFYYGQGNCLPTSLNLQASISDPSQVSDMLLFFHLQDKVSGGTTPWSDPVIMTPLGAGEYEYNLASTAIPGYASYPEAWLLYQFVATKSDGTVLLRSDVFSNVSLMVCGK